MSKKTLTGDVLDAQTAVELPDRDMMLVTIVIGNLLSNNEVEITLRDINVVAQVCAQILNNNPNLTCEVGPVS